MSGFMDEDDEFDTIIEEFDNEEDSFEEEKTSAVVEMTIRVSWKVNFNEDVSDLSNDEIMDLLVREDYEDVLDESLMEIIEVNDVEPY